MPIFSGLAGDCLEYFKLKLVGIQGQEFKASSPALEFEEGGIMSKLVWK